MLKNRPQDYEEKVKRLHTAYSCEVPDRVPIFTLNNAWGYSYSQTNINDVIHDPVKSAAACVSFLEDIYTDAIHQSGMVAPKLLHDVLMPPHPTYHITSDGYSFEHLQASEENGAMLSEEYPALIANLPEYIMNTIAPRRFPILNQPYPQNYEIIKKAYDAHMLFVQSMAVGEMYAKKVYGVPSWGTALAEAPLDFLMERLRGIKGISLDMRRHGQDVLDACDTIEKYLEENTLATLKPGDVVKIPSLMPPFMGRKNFEKFYWPSFKRMMDWIIGKGAKAGIILEGDWTPYMEYLMEFPKGSVLGIVDVGDIVTFKKLYGSKIALSGGITVEMLRHSSKEQCCDHAKKMLDILAPGGGYVFSFDKGLMYPNDINVENYKAVVETVLEYGRY